MDIRQFLSFRLFLLPSAKKLSKNIDCNGSSHPLFSIPSFLRIATDVVKFLESLFFFHQNLVEHVDDQKRFQEHSFSRVCRGIPTSRLGFLELEAIRA